MANFLFRDEAIFHTWSHVNRQLSNIGRLEANGFHADKSVWSTISGSIYLNILQQLLESPLMVDGIFESVVFHQDDTPVYFAKIVRDYLNIDVPGKIDGESQKLKAPRLMPG
ncbi:hypothetical protein Trydic_g5984 [Trypoxylus dichotomus]